MLLKIKKLIKFFKKICNITNIFFCKIKFRGLSNKEIFNKVYKEQYWGTNSDSRQLFFSGQGSHDLLVVNTYVGAVARFLRGLSFKATVLDLGCGDFNIGSKIRRFCGTYIACDIVESLIEHNKKIFKSLDVDFRTLDATQEAIPKVQVIFIRQVFQHLSNDEIVKSLNHLRSACTYLVLTEEIPANHKKYKANKDIKTSYSTRWLINSYVNLTMPPFDLKPLSEKIICTIPIRGGESLITTTVFKLN